MIPFRVHILGCGSAMPTLRHNPSAQVVEMKDKFFMVDCGEGTQIALRRTNINFNKIQAIFISHLHGDHCLGLVGMLSTFGLLGRMSPLHIYAPKPLSDFLPGQLDFYAHGLEYELVIHDVDTRTSQVIYEDKGVTIETIPLEHRVPCCGYLFREKPGLRHIKRDMLDFYKVPVSQINNLRLGMDWTDSQGIVIPNERLTSPPSPVRSYAYCSDTRFMPQLADRVKGVSLLYHEATYADDMKGNAEKYFHSTAREAAKTAREAAAKTLIIGHYSQRYDDESVLLREAKEEFENVVLSRERMILDVL